MAILWDALLLLGSRHSKPMSGVRHANVWTITCLAFQRS